MRYIKSDDLKQVFDALHGEAAFAGWEARAKAHLVEIKDLTPKQRAKYWRTNNIWSELYDAMSELSGHKCWYTEAKENSSEWQVDHFRPKAISRDENGNPILKTGYWWLSYYWKNFRLSGSLCNLLRTDRFTDQDDVFGKGNYFPLKDIKKVSAENDLRCSGEIPLLLDPTKSRDVTLISFDQNGSVFPTYNTDDDAHNNLRALLSIRCFGLEHKPLVRGRKRVWDECDNIVELTNNDLKIHMHNEDLIDSTLEACFQRLAGLAAKNQPFSIVVFNYIHEKLNQKDYYWLDGAIKAIA